MDGNTPGLDGENIFTEVLMKNWENDYNLENLL